MKWRLEDTGTESFPHIIVNKEDVITALKEFGPINQKELLVAVYKHLYSDKASLDFIKWYNKHDFPLRRTIIFFNI